MTSFFRNTWNNAGHHNPNTGKSTYNDDRHPQQQQAKKKGGVTIIKQRDGENYPSSINDHSNSYFIRSSPDRASVGAVRRRREHARKLAEIAQVEQQQQAKDTSRSTKTMVENSHDRIQAQTLDGNPTAASNYNNPRPYGVQGAFWNHYSSSNISVASSPAADTSSIASTSLTAATMMDDPFHGWEDANSNGNRGDVVTGMIVTSKQKKDKKKHTDSFTSSSSSLLSEALKRRTQMRLMAEEAAAAVTSTARFQESNATSIPTSSKQSISVSNDSWEAFPSNWEDPSFFQTNATAHTTTRRWNMQSDIVKTTTTNKSTSFYNSNNTTVNRKPPLASPQQQQQYSRNTNDTLSNPSPLSSSSFWSISKQDPPPPSQITTKPQLNKESLQVVAVTSQETIHSSSTNTSDSCSSYNSKDTRKDRIAQLTMQPKPQALETTKQKPKPDARFDAFGITAAAAAVATTDSTDRYSPSAWSVATDVPKFQPSPILPSPSEVIPSNTATTSLDCCSSTAELWAAPTSTSTTTTSSSSSTTNNDEEGRRNPFKELAGTFQTKQACNHTSGDKNSRRPRFSIARSEMGTKATSTQSSTTTTLAKAAWRNRNTTANPSSVTEPLNDNAMATATATASPSAHITNTAILPRASPPNLLNRTRSSPTSFDKALETTSVVSLDIGTNTKLPLWKRDQPSPIEGQSTGTNTDSTTSTIPWRMRLQEMKRQQQQQQREGSPLENTSDTAPKHMSHSRSSSVGNLARYNNGIAQRNLLTDFTTSSNDNRTSSTHNLSISRSSSWSNLAKDDNVKIGSYRTRRPSPVNTNYLQPKDSEMRSISPLDPDEEKLPTRPTSLPNTRSFATSSLPPSAANSDTSDTKTKNASFLHVRLKKTGSLDMLLNSNESKRKQEETSETQVIDTLIDAEGVAVSVTQEESINMEHPETEKKIIPDAQVEETEHHLHNNNFDSSADMEHAPPRDVAGLIRKRISMNMNKNSEVVFHLQQQRQLSSSPNGVISDARSRLRAPSPPFSSEVAIKLSGRRSRPPMKIDTSALRNLKKETDIHSQTTTNKEDDATLCDSVLATVNGGENEVSNMLPTAKNDLSPGSRLRKSIINAGPFGVNNTELSVRASLPNEDLLHETITEKLHNNNQDLPHYITNVGQIDAVDSDHGVRSALHEALMKRNIMVNSQEADNEAIASQANASENTASHRDDNGKEPPTVVSKRDALHLALLKSTQPTISSSTAQKSDGIGDSIDAKTSKEHAVQPVPHSLDGHTLGKYSKMLKLGLPLEAVHHAMKKDGLDTSLLNVNLASAQPSPVATSTSTSDKPVMSALGNPGNVDPKYEKYFKMIKIGIPLEAVKHSVTRDGLDPSVLDGNQAQKPASSAYVLGSAAAAMKAAFQIQRKTKDTVRRMRIHWETMNHTSVPVNSVWAMVNADPEVEEIQIDETEFKALFQEEKGDNTYSSRMGKVGIVSEKRSGVVKVIEPKRANNGGIILARVKIGFDKVADAIDRLDETALTPQLLQSIVEYLPTAEESCALKQYAEVHGNGNIADMCECEKFMIAMLGVRQAKNKIRRLLFKQQFPLSFEQLQKDATTVEQACDELFNSVRLRKLLGIVLNIGNKLNTAGSGQRKANAFTLESLLKLGQAKAFDKKTTVLDYVVLVVRRNNEFLTRFPDDLPTVFIASKIHWEQCLADLDEVESQLENIRKLALLEYRYKYRDSISDTFSPAIVVDETPLSLEQEFDALRSSKIGEFTLDAIKKVSSLRDKVELTQSKFSNLLEYFGEPGKKIQASELFAIFEVFCQNFQKANDEVIASEKAKVRNDRRKSSPRLGSAVDLAKNNLDEEKAKDQLKMEPPLHLESNSKARMLLRLSAMQPHMAPVIRELKTQKAKKTEPPCSNINPSDDNELLNRLDSEKITAGSPIIQQQNTPENFIVGSKVSESVTQKVVDNECSSFHFSFDVGDTVPASRNEEEKSQNEHWHHGADTTPHGTISSKANVSCQQQSTTPSSITIDKADAVAYDNTTSVANTISLKCSKDHQTAQSYFDKKNHAKSIHWQSQKTVVADKVDGGQCLSRSKCQELSQCRNPSNTVNDVGVDDSENINSSNENLHRKEGDLQHQVPGAKSDHVNDETRSVPFEFHGINDKKELGGDQSLVDKSVKKESGKNNYKNAIPRWQSPKHMREAHGDSEKTVAGSKYHETNLRQILSPVKTGDIVDESSGEGNESIIGLGDEIQDTTHEGTVSEDKSKHDLPRRKSSSIFLVSSESNTAIPGSARTLTPRISSPKLNATFTDVTSTKYAPHSESGTPSLPFSKRMDGSSMHSTLLKAKMMKRRRETVKGTLPKTYRNDS